MPLILEHMRHIMGITFGLGIRINLLDFEMGEFYYLLRNFPFIRFLQFVCVDILVCDKKEYCEILEHVSSYFKSKTAERCRILWNDFVYFAKQRKVLPYFLIIPFAVFRIFLRRLCLFGDSLNVR